MFASYMSGLLSWRAWFRQAAWATRVRAQARAGGAELTLDVDPTARIGSGVVVRAAPGSRSELVVGPRCRIEDGTEVHLNGGRVTLGPDCEIRARAVLHVNRGHVEMQGSNVLSWGTTVHCSEHVLLEPLASASEYVTIADSRHFHADEASWFYDHFESAPVRIGRNTWLASKSTVMMGAQVGACSVVAANSVVAGVVGDGVVVAGAPAKVVRATLLDRRTSAAS